MTLALDQTAFTAGIVSIWDNPGMDTVVYDTAYEYESYWSGASVAGYVVPPNVPVVFTPKITYGPLLPITAPATGSAAAAAAAFESSLSTMVLASIFTLIAPPVATPPPIPLPGGLATPGTLTASLTVLFSVASPSSVATTFAGLIAGYLQGWTILVTVPPSSPVPVPII